MRDILLSSVIFLALPFILLRPYLGILMWSWIGYMSPHRLTWGFAYSFPFAQIVAIVTIIGIFLSKEKKQIPWNKVTLVWLIFIIWMVVSAVFAIYPDEALDQLIKNIKIQLMSLATLLLINNKQRIEALVWVIVVSLGFYGVKGGIWTAVTGGHNRVLGPEGSFIAGNTEIGLAMVMTIPLMRYFHLTNENKWIRRGLMFSMLATALAVLGTHSRGAMLGLVAVGVFLFMKSKYKIGALVLLILMVFGLLTFMPSAWYDRMGTIEEYQTESSAMERIYAWQFSYKMALSRPIVGGGYGSYTGENYLLYAPEVVEEAMLNGIPEKKVYQAAHSIYFGTLGHLGFPGLVLFLLLGFFAWQKATFTIRHVNKGLDQEWLTHLAKMLQVSLVGYAVAGAFLSLENFDLTYHIIAMIVIVHFLAHQVEHTDTNKRRSPNYLNPSDYR